MRVFLLSFVILLAMEKPQDEHFVGKVVQKILLVKNNQVLITRDSREIVWELPGGRLNLGEGPELGVVREVMEELGVSIAVGSPVYINQFAHTADNTPALVIVYVATLADEPQEFVVDPVEVAQMQWVDADTWNTYEYYPEYAAALKTYFQNV